MWFSIKKRKHSALSQAQTLFLFFHSQIRVVEGKEPPHFLKLFDGAMVIHSGKYV
jgi:hypothetical protein